MTSTVDIPFRPDPGAGLPHSAARYTAGCRCQTCTDLHQARRREGRIDLPKGDDFTRGHGMAGWRYGCRCRTCTDAADYQARKATRQTLREQS